MDFPDAVNRIHFIGIGGCGMSAAAEILLEMGYEVSGSDIAAGENTERLKKKGAKIKIGHNGNNTDGAKLCVYSAAIPFKNSELETAAEKIETISRAELEGEISRMHDCVIGVSGTHGKTTVTAMIAEIMIKSGLLPTVMAGGRLPIIHGGGHLGDGKVMVAEACEFARSFLHMKRDIAVVLNIDNDHLEYYKTPENLNNAFSEFSKEAGTVVVCGDDKRAVEAVTKDKKSQTEIITFGMGEENTYSITEISLVNGCPCFNILKNGEFLLRTGLKIPGKHNALNAAAACAVCDLQSVPIRDIQWGLNSFCGVGRRFEIIGTRGGVTVVDDYAHHPTEIKAVLRAASLMNFKKITVIFQPFTFSRTALLTDDFADALSIADSVILTEIMGGREENTYGITSDRLAEKIDSAVVAESFEKAAALAVSEAESGGVIITMGCGDIYKCDKYLLKLL